MGNRSEQELRALCESTRMKIKEAIAKTELFLNHHTLDQLNEDGDEAMELFYRDYLQDTRHLLVYCEIMYEKLGVCLRRRQFNAEYAEKTLYDVYHKCVSTFFYPQNECYSEDGRYAYTGQDAIRFRKKPVRAVRDLTIELAAIFEELREELSYYESDYMRDRMGSVQSSDRP